RNQNEQSNRDRQYQHRDFGGFHDCISSRVVELAGKLTGRIAGKTMRWGKASVAFFTTTITSRIHPRTCRVLPATLMQVSTLWRNAAVTGVTPKRDPDACPNVHGTQHFDRNSLCQKGWPPNGRSAANPADPGLQSRMRPNGAGPPSRQVASASPAVGQASLRQAQGRLSPAPLAMSIRPNSQN